MNRLISKEEQANITELAREAKAAILAPDEIKALIWLIKGIRLAEEIRESERTDAAKDLQPAI